MFLFLKVEGGNVAKSACWVLSPIYHHWQTCRRLCYYGIGFKKYFSIQTIRNIFRLTEGQRVEVRVLAGVQLTSKNVPRPVDNVGRKCVWEHGAGCDRRRDDEFRVFSKFRYSLSLYVLWRGGGASNAPGSGSLPKSPGKTWSTTTATPPTWDGRNPSWTTSDGAGDQGSDHPVSNIHPSLS